jgi:hypothetical protein
MEIALFVRGTILLIAFLIWLYLVQSTPTGKLVGGIISVGFLIFLVVGIVYAGWNALDEKGIIPHWRETSITAQSSWLVGESKTCVAIPTPGTGATALLTCDNGPVHRIRITFWGKTGRSLKAIPVIDWKCLKQSDSFVCYALD